MAQFNVVVTSLSWQASESDPWRKVCSVFADAAECPPEKRELFLRDAVRGFGAVVVDEVRRLLAEHDRAAGFLEIPALISGSPAGDVEDSVFDSGDMLVDRFRIVRLLGAGGMGEVYEAFDSRLRHRVAIKTLRANLARDPAMVERFREEVLRSRQITHPNVARVYDLFTDTSEGREIPFFTMELLEGEPLSVWLESHGSFTPESALPLLEQMASALDAAHAAGVVHQDFKPGNIFISAGTSGARKATITDFGIAAGRAAPLTGDNGVSSNASLLAGTPAYMAPERLLGAANSTSVDIYALGLVAYEMLTGRRAYDAKSPLACVVKKTAEAEPKLFDGETDAPPSWIAAIHTAVRRDPGARFASANEFIARLKGETRAPMASRPGFWIAAAVLAIALSGTFIFARRSAGAAHPHPVSLAVLPFDHAAGDAQSVYLSDGLAEGLSGAFRGYRDLLITTQSAAAAYRDSHQQPQRIAGDLGVETLLRGSFTQSGYHLSLSAELLDGRTGRRLWTQRFDCEMEQLLGVEQEIIRQVAAHLSLGPPQPRSTKPPTANSAAYDLYLRGRYLWNTRTRDGMTKAIDYFERAAQLDDHFGLAYTGIAEANIVLSDYGWISPLEASPKVEDAFRRALPLTPDSAETQASLGLYKTLISWDQSGAEQAFQRALSSDSSLALAHHWYAVYLERARRWDGALREAQEARRLEPATLPTFLMVGWVHYYRHEYAGAIDIARQAIELHPDVAHAHQLLALSYADAGKPAEALKESAEAGRLTPDPAVALRERAWVLSRIPGQQTEARRAAAQLEAISWERQSGYLVRIYAGLRDRERMYRWADRALELHDPSLGLANADAALDFFRDEPRFREILRRLGY